MRLPFIPIAFLYALVAAGCGGKVVDTPPFEGQPPAAACPSTPIALPTKSGIATAGSSPGCAHAEDAFTWKTGTPGSACTDPLDCAPVCCPCSVPARSAVTSWCRNGTCAAPEDVCCALAGTPTISCGE
jgi:hypothetical protein